MCSVSPGRIIAIVATAFISATAPRFASATTPTPTHPPQHSFGIGNAFPKPTGQEEVGFFLSGGFDDLSRIAQRLPFPAGAPIAARDDGTPDCEFEPGRAGEFEFLPADCEGSACIEVLASVVANGGPITDGMLFTCVYDVHSPELFPNGCHVPIECGTTTATDSLGEPLPLLCQAGFILSEFPRPQITFEASVEPTMPKVGELVHITMTPSNPSGLFVGEVHASVRGTFAHYFEPDEQTITTPSLSPVTFELTAQSAVLAVFYFDLSFIGHHGCPGNEFDAPDVAVSRAYTLDIGAAGTPTPTSTPAGTVTATDTPTATPPSNESPPPTDTAPPASVTNTPIPTSTLTPFPTSTHIEATPVPTRTRTPTLRATVIVPASTLTPTQAATATPTGGILSGGCDTSTHSSPAAALIGLAVLALAARRRAS